MNEQYTNKAHKHVYEKYNFNCKATSHKLNLNKSDLNTVHVLSMEKAIRHDGERTQTIFLLQAGLSTTKSSINA